ncbi:MAG: hypothetical protein ACYSUY_12390 [Planctomycetota bacterium]|jgi:hypothetical protein
MLNIKNKHMYWTIVLFVLLTIGISCLRQDSDHSRGGNVSREKLKEWMKKKLGHGNQEGSEQRPAGWVENAKPLSRDR